MSNKTTTRIVTLGRKPPEDSIRDNIRTILLTSRGEVPFRPRFGLGAERLLGGGMQSLDIAYEVADQLSRYEKRIKLRQVVTTETESGSKQVAIHYEILTTTELQTLIINKE